MRLKHIGPMCVVAALSLAAASFPETKPEQVGLSSDRLQRIHETMQRHIQEHNITGAVTLVARQGQVAHLAAHGMMDVEANRPMAKDAIFRIWSMSKPVTGVAILMLIEEGKVRLNDPVSKFIPEFKKLNVAVALPRPPGLPASAPTPFYTVPTAREINVRDLLTHVSGLGSGPISSSESRKIPKLYEGRLADQIPKLASLPLDFQPGTKWAYSAGAAFDTLGRIVEVASGMSFEQFLQSRLFDPLGMKETSFHPTPEQLKRLVTTYHRAEGAISRLASGSTMLNLYGSTYSAGAGGLYSTAEEYAIFAQMLLNGGQWNGKRILSPKSVEWMASVFAPDTMPGRSPGRAYGLSVQVITDPIAAGQRVSTGSYGWDGAFGTHFWIDPKEKIVGILMIQVDNSARQLDRDFENAVFQAIVD